MTEYIEREKVLKTLEEIKSEKEKQFEKRTIFFEDLLTVNNEIDAIESVIEIIKKEIPTADVQPVKCGRWMCGDSRYPYCSECRRTLITGIVTEYCPRCGAKMNKNGR